MYFSKSNKKLKPNKEIEFAIFSLPAEKTCPYATELCKKSCYAKKSERLYPQVLKSREQNLSESLQTEFCDNVITYLDSRLAAKSHKGKTLYVRIHESGDFFSPYYAAKWLYISEYYIGRSDIVFMAYTKSIQYFKSKPANLLLRYSVWSDSKSCDVKRADELSIPYYGAMIKSAFNNLHDDNKCLCIDCGTCKKCYTDTEKLLVCAIH